MQEVVGAPMILNGHGQPRSNIDLVKHEHTTLTPTGSTLHEIALLHDDPGHVQSREPTISEHRTRCHSGRCDLTCKVLKTLGFFSGVFRSFGKGDSCGWQHDVSVHVYLSSFMLAFSVLFCLYLRFAGDIDIALYSFCLLGPDAQTTVVEIGN